MSAGRGGGGTLRAMSRVALLERTEERVIEAFVAHQDTTHVNESILQRVPDWNTEKHAAEAARFLGGRVPITHRNQGRGTRTRNILTGESMCMFSGAVVHFRNVRPRSCRHGCFPSTVGQEARLKLVRCVIRAIDSLLQLNLRIAIFVVGASFLPHDVPSPSELKEKHWVIVTRGIT